MLDLLAELDREADRQRNNDTRDDRSTRRGEGCNPEDHRGPQGVAENVARVRGQTESMEMHGQPNRNVGDEKNYVCAAR